MEETARAPGGLTKLEERTIFRPFPHIVKGAAAGGILAALHLQSVDSLNPRRREYYRTRHTQLTGRVKGCLKLCEATL